MAKVTIISSKIERIYNCTACGAVTVGEAVCCDEAVKSDIGFMEQIKSQEPQSPLIEEDDV